MLKLENIVECPGLNTQTCIKVVEVCSLGICWSQP